MTQFNVTVFSGKSYKVEKRNVYRNETLNLPEGTLLLASEIVVDEDEAVVELWIAVPQDAIVSTGGTEVHVPDSTIPLPAAVPVPVADLVEPTIDEAYEHYVPEEDEDDEYYADY